MLFDHYGQTLIIIQENIIVLKVKVMETISQLNFNHISSPSQPRNASNQEGRVKLEDVEGIEAINLAYSSSFVAHIVEVIQQFCHKYLESFSQATINHILRKLLKVGGNINRQKGLRELVAAVVYCQYSGVIRLKLKDFSLMNQLNQKVFNKKYVAYQTILKKESSAQNKTESNEVKIEQKLEDSITKKEQDKSNEKPQNNEPQIRPIANPKQAIELIYDGIFKTYYFQENRRELIEKMAERCSQIDHSIYEEMTWTQNYGLKLFYAIYIYLKQFGMNIGFTKFREAVATFAGFSMKRNFAHATEKIFKKFNNSQEVEDETDSLNSGSAE